MGGLFGFEVLEVRSYCGRALQRWFLSGEGLKVILGEFKCDFNAVHS